MINTEVSCRLCGFPARSYFPLGHTTVWQCTSDGCGLQFADPQPNDEQLRLAYTNLYYPSGDTELNVRFENTPKSVLLQVFRGLERRLGSLKGLRLLDYGCGRGALCQVATELGMNISGVEPDEEARRVASSIPGASTFTNVGELLSAAPNVRYDIVVLWTVIEHLRVPWKELAQLRMLLRPNGWLLVSTMNIRCLRARVERERWENYENPTHLFYFDRTSLARVIRSAGFSEVSEWKLKIRYPHHDSPRRLLYTLSFPLGLSDGLFYLGRTSEASIRPRPEMQEAS